MGTEENEERAVPVKTGHETRMGRRTEQGLRREVDKAVKSGWKAAKKAGRAVAQYKLPSSLTWIYNLSFKVGVFLLLKCYLVWRCISLSTQGLCITLFQMLLALAFILCGIFTQLRDAESNEKLYTWCGWAYTGTAVTGAVLIFLKDIKNWRFVEALKTGNALSNFFTGIFSTAKDAFLSLVFFDFELTIVLAGLLAVLTFGYLSFYITLHTEKYLESSQNEKKAIKTSRTRKFSLYVIAAAAAIIAASIIAAPRLQTAVQVIRGEVYAPSDSKSCRGSNINEVLAAFQDAGFKNIVLETDDKGLLNENNTVEKITIGGETEFSKDAVYKDDAAVVITYYRTSDTITIEKDTTELLGKSKAEVVSRLEAMGFEEKNIKEELSEQGGKKEGDVVRVVIDGKTNPAKGTVFEKKAAVTVYCYTPRKISAADVPEDYKKMTYTELRKVLMEKGFKNITVQGAGDIGGINILDKEDVVKEMTIGGKNKWKDSDVFPSDAEIIITYHSKKN